MERKIKFSINEFYHLYNRGNNKTNIFLDDIDKQRFLKLLFVCNGEKPVVFKTIQGLTLDEIEKGDEVVEIGAYCLMPNHFHILVREKKDGGISLFMNKLLTAYSMYFNKKHERTGKLFEGVFRAVYVGNDRHLEYLFAYIHLNPIKIIEPEWKEKGIRGGDRAKQFLKNYHYSSYLDYLGYERKEQKILNKENFPKYFEDFKDFDYYINNWFNLAGTIIT